MPREELNEDAIGVGANVGTLHASELALVVAVETTGGGCRTWVLHPSGALGSCWSDFIEAVR